MVKISDEARSRIRAHGQNLRKILQAGIPFKVGIGVPIANPFVEKRLLLKTQFKLAGVDLEDVCVGLMFADFRSFWDMKLDDFSRKSRTRHFKINPFTKLLEEQLGGLLGKAGIRMADGVAGFMVALLGLVEWEMRQEPTADPDHASIRIKVASRFFRGRIAFRIHREVDGVIVADDWLPEGGGDMRTATLPMANVVLMTHPLGFKQMVQRAVDEILRAKQQGVPYKGEVGPPSRDIDCPAGTIGDQCLEQSSSMAHV
jgi:hypothetical protein